MEVYFFISIIIFIYKAFLCTKIQQFILFPSVYIYKKSFVLKIVISNVGKEAQAKAVVRRTIKYCILVEEQRSTLQFSAIKTRVLLHNFYYAHLKSVFQHHDDGFATKKCVSTNIKTVLLKN